MSLFNWFFGGASSSECGPVSGTNPANGLPMVDCSVDVAGNPYGFDLNSPACSAGDSWNHPSSDFSSSSTWNSGTFNWD